MTTSGADVTSAAADLAQAAYAQHGAELYRFARRWTGEHAAAEDLVQDVMLAAWRSADRFTDQRGSLRTWLFAIARNVAVDHARRSAARARLVVATGEAQRLLPQAEADQVILADRVARALTRISDDQRAAVVETYLRDRGYTEVAAELGIPVSTLRSRVFHGLRSMRATMAAEEVDDD